MNNNISDGENRLLMMLDSYEDTPFYDIRDIIYCMNEYLKAGNKLTDTMHDIISRVKGTGCSIELTERGILKFV